MRKVIKLPNFNLEKKVALMVFIQGKELNSTEVKVLSELIQYSDNGILTISSIINKNIAATLQLNIGHLITTTKRLVDKGIIEKDGKLITFPPIYQGLNEMTDVLIKG